MTRDDQWAAAAANRSAEVQQQQAEWDRERQAEAADKRTRIENFKKAWAAFVAAGDRADAAFDRWHRKARNGEVTNAAAATRLQNLANYASTDVFNAAAKLYEIEIDPRTIVPEYEETGGWG